MGTKEKLQQLFLNYSEKLPDKLSALEHMWQQLAAHYDIKKLEDFHRAAHTLCGSAATYGFMVLSKSVRELEVCLKAFMSVERTLRQQV